MIFFVSLLGGCKNDADEIIVRNNHTGNQAETIHSSQKAEKFDVITAQLILDSAGFHGIEDELKNTQTIQSSFSSTSNSVKKVLENTAWPTSLHSKAQSLITNLGAFSQALTDNKLEKSIAFSEIIHEEQHDLSHDIDHWVKGFTEENQTAKSFDISVAQYFLDTAGFHGIEEKLTNTQTIESSYNTTTKRVKKLLENTTWPTELNPKAQSLISNLNTFSKALTDGKVEDAIALSAVIHEEQHDLSHDVDHWLGHHVATDLEAFLFDLSVSQFILDAAGFHGIEDELTNTQTINSAYNSTTKAVKKVLENTTWPTSLHPKAQSLISNLDAFSKALTDGKVEDAIALSKTVHEEQHDLSHGIDHLFSSH